MERDTKSKFSGICTLDFNSHAHVERDKTPGVGLFFVYNFNSHAHVERDVFIFINICTLLNFNSHAHVERDTLRRSDNHQNGISTHTLTWSVTLWGKLYLYHRYFNSHAHVERDATSKYTLSVLRHFNSHAHVERDHNVLEGTPIPAISTHTLTWSVTRVQKGG